MLPTKVNKIQLLDEYISDLIKQIIGIGSYGLFNNESCAALYFGGGSHLYYLQNKSVGCLML